MVQSPALHRVRPFNTPLLVGLIAAAAILFGPGIGSYPLTDGDAANHSRVARNVIACPGALSREPLASVVEDMERLLPPDLRSRLAAVATYPNRVLLRAGNPR